MRELHGQFDLDHAAVLNRRYHEKLKAKEDAVAARDWPTFVYLHERPYRVGAFIDTIDELSNKDYWFLLADVWSDSENIWQNLDDWRELWNARRAYKRYAMDANERKAFKALPGEITIYRGACEAHTLDDGMSWTLDRDKAIWFAKRRSEPPHVLLTASAKKSDAHALLLGREESEIVIDQFEVIATEYVARD